MRPQATSCSPAGYRSYGSQGDSNSSDGPTCTSSSEGTSKEDTRPVIRSSSSIVNRVKTPEQHVSRANSPTSLANTARERSFFSMNGQQIKETYRPRYGAIVSPAKPSTQMPPVVHTHTPPPRIHAQNASIRPLTRNMRGHWALQQEFKVRIFGIPTHQWTREVYFAMSTYGNVIKVDMDPGSRDNSAWVVYQ